MEFVGSAIRGGQAVPWTTVAAELVERTSTQNRRWWPFPKPDEATMKLVHRVRLSATEDEPVPFELPGLPLEGLTRARARLIRSILCGYPVRFWSVNDKLYGRGAGGELGVFETIYVDGDWSWGNPIAGVYDIVIATSWEDRPNGPAVGRGSSRHLGIGALERLEVLSMDPYDRCEVCGCWRPRSALKDSSRWFLDDPELVHEYRPRLICKRRSGDYDDYCE